MTLNTTRLSSEVTSVIEPTGLFLFFFSALCHDFWYVCSGCQPVGHDLFGKPLSPKPFTLWFITVAILQLQSNSENN